MHTPLSAPEKFVLIVVLAFGLIASLATPLSAGYDEETHFIRAWEMAHLYFVPNEQLGAKLPFPALYWDLSYRRQPIVEAIEPGFWKTYGALPLDARDYVYANVETRSVYSPLLLLPQAFTIRYLGLSLQLPALIVYYACRIAGLLSYLLLSWLAVRLIPYGKWLLAIMIVSPMAVFQASTISADTISNGIAFFFIGASLAIAGRQPVGWKGWLLQLALLALLLAGKVNLIFLLLLPFLLIPPSRFRMKYGFALLAACALSAGADRGRRLERGGVLTVHAGPRRRRSAHAARVHPRGSPAVSEGHRAGCLDQHARVHARLGWGLRLQLLAGSSADVPALSSICRGCPVEAGGRGGSR